MIHSALYVSPHNRYAIPPEHGKRLERLATGKKNKQTTIHILFVFDVQIEAGRAD